MLRDYRNKELLMRIFLLQNIPKVGMAGEIIKTSEGYARNYLIPRKLGVEVTTHNEASFANRVKTIVQRKEVVASKTSMLAETIKSIVIEIKRKVHGTGKIRELYGAIHRSEIVDALFAQKNISIAKNQVEFDTKSIKTTGSYLVTIKLSSTLKPVLTVKVVAE
jgi:large subunit ribosomal protein L9